MAIEPAARTPGRPGQCHRFPEQVAGTRVDDDFVRCSQRFSEETRQGRWIVHGYNPNG
ncbi:hypothetical protein [Erythrobacter sp.]|uniref:hypothetical protein n=1 Tax=Erythrobacter sp. TaxID=1042 RepID=UPI002E994604|nr:hypothetical protein [Erythrobacter sp.]